MDDPQSAAQIEKFIQTYGVNVEEVEQPLDSYHTFNDFFARRLKPGARPIAAPDDDSIIVSPADCRLLVFPSVQDTSRIWLKGQDFTIASLLGPRFQHLLHYFHNPAVAIARLAPQDYHRWHMPVGATVGPRGEIAGTYFSVSPRAVREVNILCTNKREVCMFESHGAAPLPSGAAAAAAAGLPTPTGSPYSPASSSSGSVPSFPSSPSASDSGKEIDSSYGIWCMIAVGAAMVSSILISDTATEGAQLPKGAEHGCFRFGGSTLILLFDSEKVIWDADLIEASRKPIETYVRQGTRIGRHRSVAAKEQELVARAAAKAGFEIELSPISPRPSPVSPGLVATATTDAARKEAHLNDEGVMLDFPYALQSNLTLVPRERDTVPARGVPKHTRAKDDAAVAAGADVSNRSTRSVSIVEQLLPSFLTGAADEQPEADSPSPSSAAGAEAASLLEEGSPGRRARSVRFAGIPPLRRPSITRQESGPSSPAPAPAVFHLVGFTADASATPEPEEEDDEELGEAKSSASEEQEESAGEQMSDEEAAAAAAAADDDETAAMEQDEDECDGSKRNSRSGKRREREQAPASSAAAPPAAQKRAGGTAGRDAPEESTESEEPQAKKARRKEGRK
jgi:phosphatidylserine decarboxylase